MQVAVTIVDDNTVEMNEEFSVQMTSMNPRVVVQQGTATVTITDDDGKKDRERESCNDSIAFSQLLILALRRFFILLLNPLV